MTLKTKFLYFHSTREVRHLQLQEIFDNDIFWFEKRSCWFDKLGFRFDKLGFWFDKLGLWYK